jgi:hypothetical protein
VRRAVEFIWRAQTEFLASRLGVAVAPELPMLPVIPLGVHAADFSAGEQERREARAQHGFVDDDVVVLFVGRLSLHAKANPLAMYLACARAAASGLPTKPSGKVLMKRLSRPVFALIGWMGVNLGSRSGLIGQPMFLFRSPTIFRRPLGSHR